MSEYKSIVSEELRDGPVPHRRCTDILFCLIFTCFFIAMITIGIIGFSNGDPDLIIYPYDSSGFQCGRPDRNTEDYKYLYYPAAGIRDSISNYTKYRICLKSCPDDDNDAVKGYSNEQVRCADESTDIFTLMDTSGDIYKANIETYESTGIWKRFCLPDPSSDYFDDVLDDVYVNGIEDWIADVWRCWTAILIVLGVSVIVSIVYLLLMRYCVGVVLWVSIIATLAAIIFFGIYIDKIAEDKYGSKEKKKTKDALNIAAVIIYCVVALFIIILIFMYRRIQLAIAIMKSGAIFLKDMPSVIFVPIIMFCLSFGFYVYWILALIFIYSSGKLKDGDSVVAKIDWDKSTRNSLYFEIVGILWINSMKIALTQFIIACTVSIWYFSRNTSGIHAITKSAYYSIRYHLGSLAFGSLLLSFVRFIKFLLWYIKEKLYKAGFEGNLMIKWTCRCIQCYVDCFERFIKFIDKNAYIQIALTGDSFCIAAKNAFTLIVENALRFAALGAIGDIFKIIGKIFITIVTSLIGFYIITNYDPWKDDIQSPVAPTCVFALIAYTVSGLFMSVYEMACDTIIQAYLIDERLHIAKTQFAPEPLQEFMKEHKDKDHKSCCCGCL
ncbi:hypothetical protein SteCoe_16026 [Stentor coeruleus]|uniref:Choline transporter-like protein n=1 Tax=Stentor coeruleus TaxID=5963 RepID=A0A1R2C286_9CILI|nr:hypothetical protein SteCoe_16026 [Stentor coeruleus]